MCSNRAFYPAAVEYPSINEFKYDADRTGYRRNIDELLKELMRTVARKIQETVSAEPGKEVEREPNPHPITAPTTPLMAKQPEQVLSDEEKREILKKGISLTINGQKMRIFESPYEKIHDKKDAVINWLRDVIISVYEGTPMIEGKTKEETVGYILLQSPKGYSGKIEMLIGIDSKSSVSRVKILTQTETPGLGANVVSEKFLKQFIGKTVKNKLEAKKDIARKDNAIVAK